MSVKFKYLVTLYNTLSRKKEVFVPISAKKVGMYACGPTVYNFSHIGNLRTYVFEDILKRVLEFNGFSVKHVMNITDVGHLTSDADEGEDKMEKGARREGKTVWDIAKAYTLAFQDDLKKMNILSPTVWCKATDHIAEQIAQIKLLEKKGYTYVTDDGVYFDTYKFMDYGKLAKLDIKGLKAGARVEVARGKKNPTDFALWKFSPKDSKRAMEWDSPWGRGFPGWHIECSAMSIKYLGDHFDIHCGGVDHLPVHHTNELAQAEASGISKPWVRYWLHGEFLNLENMKMAKSGEGFITLQTLIDKGYDPLDYRYFLLQTHYRKQLKFSYEALDAARTALGKLRARVIELRKEKASKVVANDYDSQFLSAINDDLNMPQAVALMHDMLADSLNASTKLELLLSFDKVFGLGLADVKEVVDSLPKNVVALVAQRENARKDKDFKLSDSLRDQILAAGYVVKDSKDGQKVTRK